MKLVKIQQPDQHGQHDEPPERDYSGGDLVQLERHIEDEQGECENLTEVAKLTFLLCSQVTVTGLLGHGFIPALGVVCACLPPLHQALSQIDNSCGISIDQPKRFVAGIFSFSITAIHAGYTFYQGYEIQNLESKAIEEVKQGEAIAQGKKPPLEMPLPSIILGLLAFLIMLKTATNKRSHEKQNVSYYSPNNRHSSDRRSPQR
jgi:hypothetical protein